ncbi:sulfite exporter TauE/SafE family protein [Vibrio kyushuensis]|uniref:sulfite exporter TauE/SafE family protein n=1 Tax=Vibrio kyushuensis TaxID=2910249 RepID=UPI003D0E23DF
MNIFDASILFIGSLIANTLASLSGGGAGLLQFPLLIFLGLPFSIALGTHKIASVALGLGAAYTHIKNKTCNLRLALFITITGCFGVILGANVVLLIPEAIATKTLGVMILCLGIYSRLKKSLGHIEEPTNRTPIGFFIGALGLFTIGIINGSLTAGSGLLVTLFLVRWFGLSYKQSVAYTMLCVGIVWNGIGGMSIAAAGAPIYWQWIPILLLSSFLGGSIGAHIALKRSNKTIKVCFEILTFAVGIKLVI